MAQKHTHDGLAGPMDLVSTLPFREAVAMGIVPGYWYEDRIGRTPLLGKTITDIELWERNTPMIWPDIGSADMTHIQSDNVGDIGQMITIAGLDSTGEYVVEHAELNGLTPVVLATPLCRVFRIENNSDTPTSGDVWISSVNPLDVYAVMLMENQVSMMATFTIPLGFVAFLYEGEAGAIHYPDKGVAQCSYQSRRHGEVWKTKKRFGISTTGTSTFMDRRMFPDVIPALTDIRMIINDMSHDLMSFYAAFDMLFVSEDSLDPFFLQRIGQPTSIS